MQAVLRGVIWAVGVAYAAGLSYGLYFVWTLIEWSAQRGGVLPWRLIYGNVKVSAEWRKVRIPQAVLDLHIPIAVILAILALTFAAWIWRNTLGRLDPGVGH